MKDIDQTIADLRQGHLPGKDIAETLRNEGYSLEEAEKALQRAGYIVDLVRTDDFTTMRLSGLPVKRGAAQFIKEHLNQPWPSVVWPKKIQLKGWIHPEQKEGEVYLGNVDAEEFAEIQWKTKRRGTVTYGSNNQRVNLHFSFPVFVSRQEMINAGLDPDHLFGR